MLYRDLIPDRLGGRIIASHIKIPIGGPIPDYVHYHRIGFQIIYCLAGSARLVYEDQGDPFRFEAGDLVVQPPLIRHRVLECSDGFEVLEIASPAEHPTFADHELKLPNGARDRDFSGQRFLHEKRGGVSEGVRRTGVRDATDGAADLFVVSGAGAPFEFEESVVFVVRGRMAGESAVLNAGDCRFVSGSERYFLDPGAEMVGCKLLIDSC
jgi:quercetin dioxygenase-like cupin family protein